MHSSPARSRIKLDGSCLLPPAGSYGTALELGQYLVGVYVTQHKAFLAVSTVYDVLGFSGHVAQSRAGRRAVFAAPRSVGAAPARPGALPGSGGQSGEGGSRTKPHSGRELAGNPGGHVQFTPKLWLPREREGWKPVAVESRMSGDPLHQSLPH